MTRNTQDCEKKVHNSAGIYSFMDVVAKEAEEYGRDHTSPMSEILEEIERFSLTSTAFPSMLTGRVAGKFLQLITLLPGAKHVVDVGTFTGYSALAMAEVLPQNGEVLTIENNPDYAKTAQEFFDRVPSGHRIKLRIGEALEILTKLPSEETDLVFIDADKQNYVAYYKESMRILRNGGLILADNSLWYGRIFDPKDDDSRAVAEFNDFVKADGRAEKIFLTIRDGIYLIRKRPSPE